MLQYISWPEFGLSEHSCNTTEKSTINYATENAVLSLCSMNIAKEPLGVVYFITLTGAMTIAIWSILQHFTSTRLQENTTNSTENY